MIETDLYPVEPEFKPLTSEKERMAMFGPFKYVKAPTADNPENVKIQGTWESENIVMVPLPLLSKLGIASRAQFHKKVAKQLSGLFDAWDKAGYGQHIKQWGGTYCPRLIRGGTSLSNHAFGTAFDINVPWNPLGHDPAPLGAKGSVLPLIALANEFGFFWGGHYKGRLDGMHFEIGRIL